MVMAEGLGVVGAVASIVQLVDFSTRVVRRLNEFQSAAGEIPKTFAHVQAELPLLSTTLAQLKDSIKAGVVDDATQKVLLPVVSGCNEQVVRLDDIISKCLTNGRDSWHAKGKKAFISLHYDSKVDSIRETLRSHIHVLTFYYVAASSSQKPLPNDKFVQIRRWLSAPDPSTNFQKALKLREPNTGLWLLEHDSFKRWKTDPATRLWLYGIPGCGKTILSSTVLENIAEDCSNDPGTVVAYFFFDFNVAQKQDPQMMLRSLLCQLSQRAVRVPAKFESHYAFCDNGSRAPSVDALLEALQATIQEFPHVFIVLDALDESNSRVELMEILETIDSWSLQNMRLLVTSRRERDIESSLQSIIEEKNIISLESAQVDKDIQLYIHKRLSTDRDLRKWKDDAAIGQEIETALMEGAQGMFRWAVCQLDALGKCRNRMMLRKALKSLPVTLDQTYDRILSTIGDQDRIYAIRILHWLTFAIRPLTLEEVTHAAGINIERDPAFDPDEVLQDPKEILSICSGLITCTAIPPKSNDQQGESQTLTIEQVGLAHFSVKEYLMSDRIAKGMHAMYALRNDSGHSSMALGCLEYLLQWRQPEMDVDALCKEFCLSQYAAKFWIKHAKQSATRIHEVVKVACRLLRKDDPAYRNWLRIRDMENRKFDEIWRRRGYSFSEEDPLYQAVASELPELVDMLCQNGADANKPAVAYGKTALQIASSDGFESIVRVLLDRGADVNFDHKTTAIFLAAEKGHESVVRLLLQHGATVRAPQADALIAASKKGHGQVFNLLLEAESDPEAVSQHYEPSIGELAKTGCLELLQLVAKYRPLPKGPIDSHGRSLLHLAALGNNMRVVTYLLDQGFDHLATDTKGETVLHCAASRGSLKLVNAILEKGWSPDIQRKDSWSPLHRACSRRSVKVVQRLLEAGFRAHAVPISLPQGDWSPLSVATFCRGDDILSKLPESSLSLLRAGTHETQPTNRVHRAICDGCELERLHGPRFCCLTCGDFDYCFMCKPFLDHLHEGHEWKCIERPLLLVEERLARMVEDWNCVKPGAPPMRLLRSLAQ